MRGNGIVTFIVSSITARIIFDNGKSGKESSSGNSGILLDKETH